MENQNNVNPKQQMSTPTAIVLAGVLIMVGIIMTKGGGVSKPLVAKTLSEQVGVSKASMDACVKETDMASLNTAIDKSVNDATSSYSKEDRGTPYSVVIGLNGVKTDVRGAESYDKLKKIIDDAMIGKVTRAYVGNVALSEPTDHVKGSMNPKVTIIEYSDFECPYCKQFHPAVTKIVNENPDVKWIYRNYPLHQHSFEKLVAANCVAKIKGDVAFWKYADLLFGLLKTQNDSASEQL